MPGLFPEDGSQRQNFLHGGVATRGPTARLLSHLRILLQISLRDVDIGTDDAVKCVQDSFLVIVNIFSSPFS
jgi:hypothetical protein